MEEEQKVGVKEVNRNMILAHQLPSSWDHAGLKLLEEQMQRSPDILNQEITAI